MNHYVIRGIELLAPETIGQNRYLPIMFVPDDSPVPMFAGELPALKIKSVSVTVSTWFSKIVNPAIILNPSQLTVIGNVAPNQILSYPIPCRSLRPKHVRTCVYSSNGCIAQAVLPKARIQRQNVRIGISCGGKSRPVTGISITCR